MGIGNLRLRAFGNDEQWEHFNYWVTVFSIFSSYAMCGVGVYAGYSACRQRSAGQSFDDVATQGDPASAKHINISSFEVDDTTAVAIGDWSSASEDRRGWFLGHDECCVEEILLDDNQIGASGGAAIGDALKINKSIQRLFLNCNQIEGTAAVKLGDGLKNNKSVEELILSDNEIDDEGAIALAEALKTNTTLKRFNIDVNAIGDRGGKALAEAFKENDTLEDVLLEDNPWGDQVKEKLREAKNHRSGENKYKSFMY